MFFTGHVILHLGYSFHHVLYRVCVVLHVLNYLPSLDPNLCKELGTDIVKFINKFSIKDESSSNYKDVSVSVSAALTAYGTIHITKPKYDVLNKGGKIYYSNTDSIISGLHLH